MALPSTVDHFSLQARAAGLVKALGGVWREHGSMCRCPAHSDRTPSLSVRVGDRSLLFKCFAGCTRLEVLQALRHLKLHVPTGRGSTVHKGDTQDLDLAMTARAIEIWRSARPVEGSRAAAYLASRGIHRAPRALRYHPHTPIGRGRAACFRPALIAAVREADSIVAIQRSFLDRERPALARDLARPRLMLGRPRSGAIMLGQPDHCLGLAEGVETALSAAILLGIPVWAALGNERLAHIAIPAGLERLILLPDNDRAGRLAEDLARAAHARAGLAIETLWPWGRRNDWNDVLQAGGKAVGSGVRQMA